MPRIIYSLHLDCEREPGEPITGVVVQLDVTEGCIRCQRDGTAIAV